MPLKPQAGRPIAEADTHMPARDFPAVPTRVGIVDQLLHNLGGGIDVRLGPDRRAPTPRRLQRSFARSHLRGDKALRTGRYHRVYAQT